MTAHQRLAYQRLYKNHGTSIGYWEGWVEGTSQEAKVVLQYAKSIDGAVNRREYTAAPKNVGRSNETTSLEQAQLELDSRGKKQLDKGYVRTQEEAKLPSTNTLGLEKPMLAQPMEKVKPDDIDWDDAYAQAKLDGHRALWKGGVLYSRQGKPLHLPHIVEAIREAGLNHLHLDGEIYLHGKTLQEIASLVKRYQPGSEKLEYHVYDVVGSDSWRDRVRAIEDARTTLLLRPDFPIKPVTASAVASAEALEQRHVVHLAQGYEGTMLRWGRAGYQDGKRSKHLLKIKNFQDAEFTIIGVQEGTPYVTNGYTYRVPVWVCEVPGGATFTCTAQGNMHEKNALWNTREKHIGRPLTVKFHYYSKDGIPQLPVALRFHETV